MSVMWTDQITLKWANATQGRVGTACKQTLYDTADVSDNINLPPLGVLINEPKQNEMATIQLCTPSRIFKGVAATTLAIGNIVGIRGATGPAAPGKFSPLTISGTYVTANKFMWGIVISPGAVNEIVQIMGMPGIFSANEAN